MFQPLPFPYLLPCTRRHAPATTPVQLPEMVLQAWDEDDWMQGGIDDLIGTKHIPLSAERVQRVKRTRLTNKEDLKPKWVELDTEGFVLVSLELGPLKPDSALPVVHSAPFLRDVLNRSLKILPFRL